MAIVFFIPNIKNQAMQVCRHLCALALTIFCWSFKEPFLILESCKAGGLNYPKPETFLLFSQRTCWLLLVIDQDLLKVTGICLSWLYLPRVFCYQYASTKNRYHIYQPWISSCLSKKCIDFLLVFCWCTSKVKNVKTIKHVKQRNIKNKILEHF